MGGAFLIIVMKVVLLKRHQGFNKGDIVEVDDVRARYWIGCGVAKKHTSKSNKNENKNGKPKDLEDK